MRAGRRPVPVPDPHGRPTGPLHVGHLFGTLANRVRLQDLGADVLVLVADQQVVTDRETTGEIRANEFADATLRRVHELMGMAYV